MIPILHDKDDTSFATNGMGALSDCISCVVTEERNGTYELEMTYPVGGQNYENITYDMLVKAKPNQTDSNQMFRIYYISRPIGGTITIRAEHISYQLRHIPLAPFTAGSTAEAFSLISSQSAVSNPFTFITDIDSSGEMIIDTPTTCRSVLTAVTETYGGEQQFDNYTVYLKSARGADRGVQILYGKNLVDLTQEENITNLVTGIYPFYKSESGIISLPEKVLQIASEYSYPRIAVVDLSQKFDTVPTVDQLRSAAEEYIEAEGIGQPEVSITIDFVNLGDTLDFANMKGIERVCLCDTVKVKFEKLGVDAKAQVTKTEYNVLQEKYDKIIVGHRPGTISDTIIAQSDTVKKAVTTSVLQKAIARATSLITGNSGGYVVLDPPESPQRLLVMDAPDKNTASHVWQWNLSGLGYSSTGINGPYGLAMTMDGAINANYIATGTLDAAKIGVAHLDASSIASGKLKSTNGELDFDLDTGILKISQGDQYNSVLQIQKAGLFWLKGNVPTGYISTDDVGKLNVMGCDMVETDILRVGDKSLSLLTETIDGKEITYLGWENAT